MAPTVRGSRLLCGLVAGAVLVGACSTSSPRSGSASSTEPPALSTTEVEFEAAQATTVAPTTTTTATTTSLETTTTNNPSPSEFEQDVELIMDLYAGWTRAVDIGQGEIEAYLAAHLYPDLPECAPGEKTLPRYTAQRGSIQRADDWTISWGQLDGVRPDGRLYEVQLEERDSPSHVAILHGVAYVFWNCKGRAPPGTVYAVPPTEPGGPIPQPGPYPGSGGFLGSGCSPGTDRLPDGVWFGQITQAKADTVEFDLMCLAWPDETSDGHFGHINNSPRIRTVPLDEGAPVYAIAPDGWWMLQPYSTWYVENPTQERERFCFETDCWNVWLYINGGRATEIVQEWFP